MIAKVIRNTDESLGYETLAGSSSDGLPVGTIIALYSNTVPTGFLPCNGVEYDIEQYPALYILLASNKTPDLRECNLVGIGQSTREAIAVHDIYTVGQFKDDQFQGHEHTFYQPSTTASISDNDYNAGLDTYLYEGSGTTDSTVEGMYGTPRTGNVTRGKQVGVNYAIKATTGVVTIGDSDLYNQIIAYVDDNYIKFDTESVQNGNLIKYDAENNEFVAITPATENNTVLTAYVDTDNDWTYNGNKYDAEMNLISNDTDPASTSLIGTMTSDHYTVQNYQSVIWYYINDANEGECYFQLPSEKHSTLPYDNYKATERDVSYDYLFAYNSTSEYTDYKYVAWDSTGTSYYGVTNTADVGSSAGPFAMTMLQNVTEIPNLTFGTLKAYVVETADIYAVTGFETTGLTLGTQVTDDSTWESILAATSLNVYCNTYVGTDFDYTWEENSSGSLAFVGTEAEYETAKLISPEESGHIPNDAAVVLTDKTSKVKGIDAPFTLVGSCISDNNGSYSIDENGVPDIADDAFVEYTAPDYDTSSSIKVTNLFSYYVDGVLQEQYYTEPKFLTERGTNKVYVYGMYSEWDDPDSENEALAYLVTGIDPETGIVSYDTSDYTSEMSGLSLNTGTVYYIKMYSYGN